MNKVLVEVYVPSVGNTFDVSIPLESKVSEVSILLSHAIEELLEGKYISDKNVTICDFANGKEYEKNKRIYETNIDNGTKIMIT